MRIRAFISAPLFPLAVGATANLDSLWLVWQDVNRHDTLRCKAIDDLAWEGFVYSDPDSALALGHLMYDFAKKKNLKKQQCQALNTLGISHWTKADYVTAIGYYEKSRELSETIGNKHGVAVALNNIGAILNNQGNYPKALKYFKHALKIYEDIGAKKGIAVSTSNIGRIYEEQGDTQKALTYSRKSLEIYEQLKDKYGIAIETLTIGNMLAQTHGNETGLPYFMKAIELRKEIADHRGLIASYNMLGSLLSLMGQEEEALNYHQLSIDLAKKIGEERGLAISIVELGITQLRLGQYTDAIINCEEAYHQLKELGILKQQRAACNCLYNSYKELGDTKNALLYFEKEQELADSLQVTTTAKKLQQMEFEKALLADSAERYVEELNLTTRFEKELIKEHNLRNVAIITGLFALLLAFGLYRRSRYIKRANAKLKDERDRSDELLLNILPHEVAEELKTKGKSEARSFDNVTVIFTDFARFTETTEKLTAKELVSEINACFEAFDGIIEKYKVEKIKTIGDAYMAAGGLHKPRTSEPRDVVKAALEMKKFITERKAIKNTNGEIAFEMRVGIHTGPVVAGIVGVKKFQYDIWGDTVNTASRIESKGEAGKVNISHATYKLLKDKSDFTFESRGKIAAKGKGEIEMWFVSKQLA